MTQLPESESIEGSRNEVLVTARCVSKKFCRSLKRSMAYGILELSRNMLGLHNDSSRLRHDEFWAVREISFELRRGDVLGLIGVNGSGKSTLLRLLTGIFPPDQGEIAVKGRVGSLIAVGAGFHPHMTGRENIYLNATILGMNRREIDAKFENIVDFAEIEDFLDAPVSTYSSGMRVRLGFAIAVQVKPDVLFIDEVLAVGDVGFQAKCYNAIASLSNRTAVIFVSHSMSHISKICNRVAVMEKGSIAYLGSQVAQGIEHYYSYFPPLAGMVTGGGKALVKNVSFESAGRRNIAQVEHGENLTIRFQVSLDPSVESFVVDVSFLNQAHMHVAQCNSLFNDMTFTNSGGLMDFEVQIPEIYLNPGIYLICIGINDVMFVEIFASYIGIAALKVLGKYVGGTPLQIPGKWGMNIGVED